MDLAVIAKGLGASGYEDVIGLLMLLVACVVVHFVTHRVVVRAVRGVVARSRTTWDDALVDAELFGRLSPVATALTALFGVKALAGLSPLLVLTVQRVALSAMVAVVARALSAFLTAVNDVYSSNLENRERPIKGYIQVVKILLAIAAALLVLAILLDRSPVIFLSGLAGMTAVLLLIFRDTLLSLVASVQLTSNDMVHVGDWIEMPQCGADGDVIDIALHTVKVQNFDKTIVTIPTHRMISDSFKNWRGMSESRSRRIKRAIYVDMASVRFLEEDEVDRFERFAMLRDYIRGKREELAAFNAEEGRDPEINADIRRLTNVGTFRAYIEAYLKAHPKIHLDRTLLVRQLAPTSQGLPIEIYCFSSDFAWGRYEAIQADIFDHILAIAREFEVRIFQQPSGADLSDLAEGALRA